MGLEDQEDDVLLARARHAFLDAEFLGHLQQFVRGLAFQFVEIDQRTVAAAVAGIVDVVVVLLRLEALLIVVAARLVAVLIAMAVAIAAAALAVVLAALALLAVFAVALRLDVAGGVVGVGDVAGLRLGARRSDVRRALGVRRVLRGSADRDRWIRDYWIDYYRVRTRNDLARSAVETGCWQVGKNQEGVAEAVASADIANLASQFAYVYSGKCCNKPYRFRLRGDYC